MYRDNPVYVEPILEPTLINPNLFLFLSGIHIQF
jgi:hypothetical protein